MGDRTVTLDMSPALEASKRLAMAFRGYRPPEGLTQLINTAWRHRNCEWCGDYLPVFGPQSVDFGNGYAHQECADAAERFALKSSIRNRTNPTAGYFPGWRTT